MSFALVATLLLAAGAPAQAPPAILAVSEDLAARAGPPADGRRALLLVVDAQVPTLARAVETALAGALARRGYAVAPLRGDPDPEARARAEGADWLLRVQAGLVPGRPEIALVAEVIPTWTSFFLQRRPGARPVPPRMIQARTAADPETLLAARPVAERGVTVRMFARIPGRVLALAAGDAGGGTAVLAVTATEALLLGPSGEVLARRALDPAGRRPVRALAATAAVGDLGAGRLGWAIAGAPRGEIALRRGGVLEIVAAPSAAPLCAGEGAALFGAFAPGKGVLLDALSRAADPPAAPRSPRELFGVAAAPHGGPIAFAALATDQRLELLGPDLSRAAPPLDRVGAGFALADLDGDGAAEVVASAAEPGAPDRIRVVAPLASTPLVFESSPVEGALLAGAAADLTGDGIDDALLAAVAGGPDGGATDLLLVTADPREAR
jgi:hypothetical protein